MSYLPSWLESLLPSLFLVAIGSIIGSIVSIVASYFVQRKLQNRAWRVEYVLRNTEKTYIPLYAEITKAVRDVRQYQPPDDPPKAWTRIKEEGLIGIIQVDDVDLYDKIMHFYESVYPRLRRELDAAQKIAKNDVLNVWENALLSHFKPRPLAGIDIPSRARSFSGRIWGEDIGEYLLKHDLEGANVAWNLHKDYILGITDAKALSVDESWFSPVELAEPKLQNLESKQKELINLLEEEKVDKIIKRLKDRIGKPWR